MRRVFAAPVVASMLCGAASAGMAMGFGAVANAGRLGQRLDFSVVVKLEAHEQLAPECVAADVGAGDQRIAPAQVRTRLVATPRPGELLARVRTTTRIGEPVVTVSLSLGCPPSLTHKFVTLLDPPLPAPMRRAALVPAATDAAAALPASASTPASLPAMVAAGAASAAGGASQAASAALEERLARMQADLAAMQQSLAVLQARLREVAVARATTDPAIYGLMTLVVLLLATIAWLLWRLAKLQNEQAWLRESQLLGDMATRGSPRGAPTVPPLDEATMTSMRVLTEPPRQLADEPPPTAVDTVHGNSAFAVRVRRELLAEDLIDLEQQADFFVALGQEEAAIDLLMGHVRSSGGTSPMPYLKLLEIYRRRGDGEAYERIRERFNRRFNAHAGDWSSPDPLGGRPLEAHGDVMARLAAVWPTPAQAMDLLESLLFRRDASDETFDLPAYEELLFLYALAREHAGHDGSPDGVDLLLPIGEDDEAPAILHAEVTRPPESWAPPPVDVELDLPPQKPEPPSAAG